MRDWGAVAVVTLVEDHELKALKVEGMGSAEARRLIEDLTSFAAEPRFVYRHKWETDDILMWDNRCTMHRRDGFDPTTIRIMHRTTTSGERPV